jgi:UDP-galactopyranose mutase
MKFAIIGAGFSGAILANELAKDGHDIHVFESRSHVGGNCYSERDASTGIMVHKYGPHIFHTDNEKVWNYLNQFVEFLPYVNRVKTTYSGQVYSLPINLHTINQFFKMTLSPDEAINFINSIADKKIKNPENFEEQALSFIGKDLYEAFFKGYTIKQWGMDPSKLPATILKRLPVRFDYNDNYFSHKYQGMPKEGYTPIFDRLLSHPNIQLHLNKSFSKNNIEDFEHIFYSGPIDGWFNYKYGMLEYRTLDFVEERHKGNYQGCAVMNYADQEVSYTRITEHKYFSPWESHQDTLIFKEFSRRSTEKDIPYYPVRLVKEKEMLKKYIEHAKHEKNISFIGRLGTYRYLDMDVTVSEALEASQKTLTILQENKTIPTFFVEPI